MKKIQDTINTLNRAQMEMGSMELKKHEMLHQLAVVKDEMNVLQAELQKEYGTVDVNITDGTINYEDGKADS